MKLDLTHYRQPLHHFVRTFQPEDVSDSSDAYRIVAPTDLAFEIHKDKDLFREVSNASLALANMVKRIRSGKYRAPDEGLHEVREK